MDAARPRLSARLPKISSPFSVSVILSLIILMLFGVTIFWNLSYIVFVLGASWIRGLAYDIGLGNSRPLLLHMVSLFLLSPLVFLSVTHLCRCPTDLGVLVWVFFFCRLFLFSFLFWGFLWRYPQAQKLVPQPRPVPSRPSKAFFLSPRVPAPACPLVLP